MRQTFTTLCFGAAGALLLVHFNAWAGLRSAVAATQPRKVIVSATAQSSQKLRASQFVYYQQSKAVLRQCPWLAEKLNS